MIRGMHHTCICTADLDRAVEFYLNILPDAKLALRGQLADNPKFDAVLNLDGCAAQIAVIRAQNAYLELIEFSRPRGETPDSLPQANNLGFTHVCFDVDDVWVEFERCKGFGMTFHGEPQDFADFGVRSVYGRDPDGNFVELQEITNCKELELF